MAQEPPLPNTEASAGAGIATGHCAGVDTASAGVGAAAALPGAPPQHPRKK